jgi:hypothetical protein
VATVSHIGKELNRLEGVQAGLVEGIDEVLNQHDDFYRRVFVPLALPILRELGVRETARRTGASVASTSAALAQRSKPRPSRVRSLTKVGSSMRHRSSRTVRSKHHAIQ